MPAFIGYQHIHTRHSPNNIFIPVGGLVKNDTGGKVPGAPRLTIPDQLSYLNHVVTTTDDISYYFPIVAAGQTPYPRQIVTGSYSHLADTVGVLEEHNGLLSLEGTPYGRVAKGDHVQITMDKRVIINGTERLPN